MATNQYIDPALVPRRNSQLGATMQMGVPPPAAKLSTAPRALPQNNPQLAATSGVAGVVPPAAAKLSVAPQRFSSGLPGVQGPAMPQGMPAAQGAQAPRQMPAGIIGGATATTPTRARLIGSASGAAGASLLAKAPAPPSGTAQPVPPAGAAQPSTVIGFTGDGQSGKANAAAPGQVALSEGRPAPTQEGYTQINSGFYRAPNGAVTQGQAPTTGPAVAGRPLPGSPLVGADGSVQYDQAWADKNKALIAGYAEKNVMPMGVPGPGVAASMVTGGNMPSGPLGRPARQGFTAADRATQLDNMDRQSQQYATRSLNERAVQAAKYGNADAGALQEAAKVAGLAQPPRIQPLQRQDPNDAARLGMEQQRLGMDQQQAGLVAEQTKLGTQSQQLQLKQAQQMQALSEQLMQGTPEQKQAAAASLAALQGTKPGEPVKVKRKVPTGQVDALGQPVMGEEEVLYLRETGEWKVPPSAAAGAGQPPPQAIDYLKQNDTPQTRAAFQAKYGVDPATILG